MKVFRFYPELESGQFQECRRKAAIITLYGFVCYSAPRYTGVELLFICIRAVQSLSSDKRIAPHFLYYCRVSEHERKELYE